MSDSNVVTVTEVDVLKRLAKGRTRAPEESKIWREIWTDFRTMMVQGQILPDALARLEARCADRRTSVSHRAAGKLFKLGKFAPTAIAPAILRLMTSRNANARFAAMIALSSHLPENVQLDVLKSGLTDRSANVRWKAGEYARIAGLVVVIPELKAAYSKETNRRTKDSLGSSLNGLLELSAGAPQQDFHSIRYVFKEPSIWS